MCKETQIGNGFPCQLLAIKAAIILCEGCTFIYIYITFGALSNIRTYTHIYTWADHICLYIYICFPIEVLVSYVRDT